MIDMKLTFCFNILLILIDIVTTAAIGGCFYCSYCVRDDGSLDPGCLIDLTDEIPVGFDIDI